MGSMYIIHASITEYLIIYGTPLGTEGHTGRHTADDYFHILEGEEWAAPANSLVMERYPRGTVHHMRRGDKKQYKMHEGCWALELAQGEPCAIPITQLKLILTYRLDSANASVRICGQLHQHIGHGHSIPHDKDYRKRDDEEFVNRKVVGPLTA